MESTDKKSIDILNSLLEIHNDRIEAYGYASKETDESYLKNQFTQFANTSYECKQELVSEIRKLGGTPVHRTHPSGKVYRAWLDIKAALTSKDILNSCEFGEDAAVRSYENALQDNLTESNLRTLIHNQHARIKADHDKVKTLRDSLVAVRV